MPSPCRVCCRSNPDRRRDPNCIILHPPPPSITFSLTDQLPNHPRTDLDLANSVRSTSSTFVLPYRSPNLDNFLTRSESNPSRSPDPPPSSRSTTSTTGALPQIPTCRHHLIASSSSANRPPPRPLLPLRLCLAISPVQLHRPPSSNSLSLSDHDQPLKPPPIQTAIRLSLLSQSEQEQPITSPDPPLPHLRSHTRTVVLRLSPTRQTSPDLSCSTSCGHRLTNPPLLSWLNTSPSSPPSLQTRPISARPHIWPSLTSSSLFSDQLRRLSLDSIFDASTMTRQSPRTLVDAQGRVAFRKQQ